MSRIPVRKPNASKKAPKKSLYLRLGGAYGIAKVVRLFSEAVLEDAQVGRQSPNEQLREWSVVEAEARFDGLVFHRTLWLCQVAGGPQKFVSTHSGAQDLNLEQAHCPLEISGPEFERVAAILGKTMVKLGIGKQERDEVLAAFGAHKPEVTSCPYAAKSSESE